MEHSSSNQYIFILTNSQDVTADYLTDRMRKQGVLFLRLDTDTILPELAVDFCFESACLNIKNIYLYPEQISGIWFRRPKPINIPSQLAQNLDSAERGHFIDEYSSAIEGFLSQISKCKWINHPSSNSWATNKIYQLHTAKKFGFKVPETIVTQDFEKARNFIKIGPSIVKPLRVGYFEREFPWDDTHIYTNDINIEILETRKHLLSQCPTLFQRRVQKSLDVRVTVIDSNIHGVSLRFQECERQRTDIRRNNMIDVVYDLIDIPESVSYCILDICRYFDLRFAAVDLAIDETGQWWFFEINANGQWAWLDLLGVTDIGKDLICALLRKWI
jgi:glutathione synthase/RimK-type ligase-like ATP-grasp enzyme